MSTAKKIVYGLLVVLLGLYLVGISNYLLSHLVSYAGTFGLIVTPLTGLVIILGYAWIVYKYICAINNSEKPKK